MKRRMIELLLLAGALLALTACGERQLPEPEENGESGLPFPAARYAAF